MSQHNEKLSPEIELSGLATRAEYTAPEITVLGTAEELTRANEDCTNTDCAFPGATGCDDVCS